MPGSSFSERGYNSSPSAFTLTRRNPMSGSAPTILTKQQIRAIRPLLQSQQSHLKKLKHMLADAQTYLNEAATLVQKLGALSLAVKSSASPRFKKTSPEMWPTRSIDYNSSLHQEQLRDLGISGP